MIEKIKKCFKNIFEWVGDVLTYHPTKDNMEYKQQVTWTEVPERWKGLPVWTDSLECKNFNEGKEFDSKDIKEFDIRDIKESWRDDIEI